jgi:hypothetical protein
MKKSTLLISMLAMMPLLGHAECYMRSSTLNQFKDKIERTADVDRDVVAMPGNKMQCTVTFRVQIDGQWVTAQGRAVGDVTVGDNQLCAQAQDAGRVKLLQRVGGSETTVSQELVCTDQDIPKWKPVKVGDTVRESEVAPHPDVNKRQSFPYMGTECKWFIETVPYGVGGLIQNQGIICRMRNSQWYVKEKWVHVVDK